MSLNNAHSGKGVILFSGEQILQHHDKVDLSFDKAPGNGEFKGTKNGNVYLTNQRVIFITSDNKDPLQSISMPFFYMKQVEVKQPIFGANALAGLIKAQPNGNWEGEANFKFSFKTGGAIEFGERLLRVATKAPKGPPSAPGQAPPQPQPQYYPQPMPANPNPYSNPTAPPTGYAGYPPQGGYPPPAGTYPPPPGGYAGYPPAGTAYQNGQAYPPTEPAYPPPAYTDAVGQAGSFPSAPPATDPGGNAYYNPANPQQAYIPQATQQANPPAYCEKPKME